MGYEVTEWRRLGVNPRYLVSRDGRLRLDVENPRYVRGYLRRDGVVQVTLTREGRGGQHTAMLHKLVFETFVGPVKPGEVIVHKDGDPRNCAVDNLYAMNRGDYLRERNARLGIRRRRRRL